MERDKSRGACRREEGGIGGGQTLLFPIVEVSAEDLLKRRQDALDAQEAPHQMTIPGTEEATEGEQMCLANVPLAVEESNIEDMDLEAMRRALVLERQKVKARDEQVKAEQEKVKARDEEITSLKVNSSTLISWLLLSVTAVMGRACLAISLCARKWSALFP